MNEQLPSADRVIQAVKAAIANPAPPMGNGARLADLKAMIASFRADPVGGRLLPLKRLAFRLLGSAFDRQTRILEETAELLADIEQELDESRRRRPPPPGA